MESIVILLSAKSDSLFSWGVGVKGIESYTKHHAPSSKPLSSHRKPQKGFEHHYVVLRGCC